LSFFNETVLIVKAKLLCLALTIFTTPSKNYADDFPPDQKKALNHFFGSGHQCLSHDRDLNVT